MTPRSEDCFSPVYNSYLHNQKHDEAVELPLTPDSLRPHYNKHKERDILFPINHHNARNLNDFPDEIILTILSYLSYQPQLNQDLSYLSTNNNCLSEYELNNPALSNYSKDILKCFLVNKRFCRLVSKIVYHTPVINTAEKFVNFAITFSNSASWLCSTDSNKNILNFNQTQRKLTTNPYFAYTKSICLNIQHLQTKFAGENKKISNTISAALNLLFQTPGQRIDSLYVYNSRCISNYDFQKTSKFFKNIKSLKISNRFFSEISVIKVIFECPTIKKLDFSGFTWLSDFGLSEIGSRCKQLESINLSGCPNISETGLFCLIASQSINHINNTFPNFHTILSLCNLSKDYNNFFSNLPSSSISNYYNVLSKTSSAPCNPFFCNEYTPFTRPFNKDGSGVDVWNAQTLKVINISNCPHISPAAIGMILVCCPNLTTLIIMGCSKTGIKHFKEWNKFRISVHDYFLHNSYPIPFTMHPACISLWSKRMHNPVNLIH